MAFKFATGAGSPDTNGFVGPSFDSTGCTQLTVFIVDGDKSTTFVDSKGNTWVPTTASPGSFADAFTRCWTCKTPTVGTGHTLTLTSTAKSPAYAIIGFDATDQTSDFDQENQASVNFATTIQPGSVTPTADGEIVVTGCCYTDGSDTLSISGGFTIGFQAPLVGGAHYGIGCAYVIQTTAAAANPTWTESVNGNLRTAKIVTVKATPPPPPAGKVSKPLTSELPKFAAWGGRDNAKQYPNYAPMLKRAA